LFGDGVVNGAAAWGFDSFLLRKERVTVQRIAKIREFMKPSP